VLLTYISGLDLMVIKEASNVSPFFKLRPPKVYFGATLDWANQWLGIEDLWRVVIKESDVRRGVILVIQGKI
jgi:hypothetical protein